jgi:futalosine hydrolase
VRLCGFGQVAAAARAAALIARHSPRQIVLVGIAGSLSDAAPIGGACEFTTIIADGIGVGSGAAFRSAGEMGWAHWPGEPPHETHPGDSTTDTASLVTISPRIVDRIVCDTETTTGTSGGLLSVCAASSDPDHAAIRRRAYPDAIAEEMEAFGVAVACRLAGVRLRVIRGISNRAGSRDLKNWKIESALAAAAELVRDAIKT